VLGGSWHRLRIAVVPVRCSPRPNPRSMSSTSDLFRRARRRCGQPNGLAACGVLAELERPHHTRHVATVAKGRCALSTACSCHRRGHDGQRGDSQVASREARSWLCSVRSVWSSRRDVTGRPHRCAVRAAECASTDSHVA
jgi:hypothetical protein